jgi:hypothetical protein
MRAIRVRKLRSLAMIEWNKLPENYRRVLSFKNLFKKMKRDYNGKT